MDSSEHSNDEGHPLMGLLSGISHAMQMMQYNDRVENAGKTHAVARLCVKEPDTEEAKDAFEYLAKSWKRLCEDFPGEAGQYPGDDEVRERMAFFAREDFVPVKMAGNKVLIADFFAKDGCYEEFECCEHVSANIAKTVRNAELMRAKHHGKPN